MMYLKSLSRVAALLVCVCAVGASVGCGSLPVTRKPYGPGKVAILPTRDVVQNGEFHKVSPGSGKHFDTQMEAALRGTAYQPVRVTDGALTHTKLVSKEEAVAAGKEAGADYALYVVLGEFLNAAPMSFRPDRATLDSAVMYKTDNGVAVWKLQRPLHLDKSNLGNHLPLLTRFARLIAADIAKGGAQ